MSDKQSHKVSLTPTSLFIWNKPPPHSQIYHRNSLQWVLYNHKKTYHSYYIVKVLMPVAFTYSGHSITYVLYNTSCNKNEIKILIEWNTSVWLQAGNSAPIVKHWVASKINTSQFHSDPHSCVWVDDSQIIRFYLFWIDSVHFVNRLTFFCFTCTLAESIFLTRIRVKTLTLYWQNLFYDPVSYFVIY